MGGVRAALACLALAGCAVAEHPYPLAWDPLIPRPESDCRDFQGRYADRGERGEDAATKTSLTRELFGEFSDWEEATVVELALPKAGVVEIKVSGKDGPIFSRTLEGRAVSCRDGRLALRDRHWIAGYIMSGRQHIWVELNDAGPSTVARVDETAYGLMFIIFPVIGTAQHWYRFARLP